MIDAATARIKTQKSGRQRVEGAINRAIAEKLYSVQVLAEDVDQALRDELESLDYVVSEARVVIHQDPKRVQISWST